MLRLSRLALLILTAAVLGAPAPVSATWSVIAVDARTGVVVIASATCVTAENLRTRGGLKSIQAILVPGVGVAAAQASVDRTRSNQNLIFGELQKGTDPDEILSMLSLDENFERRQFAIVDLQGRAVGFSGTGNRYAALAVQSEVRDQEIYFAVQGNILESDAVVLDAVAAFLAEDGTVVDRVMAAMEAADLAGGDARCSCSSEVVPETDAECRHRSAHVAYIAAAKPEDSVGSGHSDGDYSLFIDVDDENTLASEDANPVATLRQRYDRWKADGGLSQLGLGGA